MGNAEMKPCIRCGATDRNNQERCKPCKNAGGVARRAAWRAANPFLTESEKRDKIRAWEKANREKRRIQTRKRIHRLRDEGLTVSGPRRYEYSDGGKYSMYA